MVGITIDKVTYVSKKGFEWLGNFPNYLNELIVWIVILNIAIGIMNLLPIWITDGGQIFYTMLNKYFSEKNSMIWLNIISLITSITIVLMLFPKLLISLIKLFL